MTPKLADNHLILGYTLLFLNMQMQEEAQNLYVYKELFLEIKLGLLWGAYES